MIVFRVQCEHGNGPYNARCECRNSPALYDARCAESFRHRPAPWSDPIQGFDEMTDEERANWTFGFPNRYALFQWWGPHELTAMARLGFKVRKIAAERVRISASGAQCIFRRA